MESFLPPNRNSHVASCDLHFILSVCIETVWNVYYKVLRYFFGNQCRDGRPLSSRDRRALQQLEGRLRTLRRRKRHLESIEKSWWTKFCEAIRPLKVELFLSFWDLNWNNFQLSSCHINHRSSLIITMPDISYLLFKLLLYYRMAVWLGFFFPIMALLNSCVFGWDSLFLFTCSNIKAF